MKKESPRYTRRCTVTAVWYAAALVSFGLIVFCSSCSSLKSALALPTKESWSSQKGAFKGTVTIGKISVDSISLWNSLEREISGVLPLLFLEKGYYVSRDNSHPAGQTARLENSDEPGNQDSLMEEKPGPDFLADVSLIEREFMEGWKTKRSISVELRIWDVENTGLPLAAGRAMLSSAKSLASSQITDKLLRLALGKALSSLKKRRA